jgi:hypothetical protein
MCETIDTVPSLKVPQTPQWAAQTSSPRSHNNVRASVVDASSIVSSNCAYRDSVLCIYNAFHAICMLERLQRVPYNVHLLPLELNKPVSCRKCGPLVELVRSCPEKKRSGSMLHGKPGEITSLDSHYGFEMLPDAEKTDKASAQRWRNNIFVSD